MLKTFFMFPFHRRKSSDERLKRHLGAKFIADASIPDGVKIKPNQMVIDII